MKISQIIIELYKYIKINLTYNLINKFNYNKIFVSRNSIIEKIEKT